jgi:hypothetical protein
MKILTAFAFALAIMCAAQNSWFNANSQFVKNNAPVLILNLCGDTTSSSGCTPTTSTTAYDASGNGNNATWHGTAAGGVSGTYYTSISGWSLPYWGYFNGTNDYLTVPDNSKIQFGTAGFSYILWFKYTSAATHTLISKSSSSSFQSQTTSAGNYIETFFASGSAVCTPTIGTTTNTMYMLAVTRSTSHAVAQYINGSLDCSGSSSANVSNSGTNLYIGANVTPASYLAGYAGYVQLWNYCLTATQVSALYTAELTLMEEPPWWRKDQLRVRERTLLS